MSRRTRRAGARLLAWCGVRNEPLLGDLDEQVAAGRSRAWYWHEVAAAIVAELTAEIRTHAVVSLRAALAAWWLLPLAMSAASTVSLTFLFPFVRSLPWWLPFHQHLFTAVEGMMMGTACALAAYAICRAHRTVGAVATICVGVIVLLRSATDHHLWYLLTNANDARLFPYLVLRALTVTGTLAAALLAAGRGTRDGSRPVAR